MHIIDRIQLDKTRRIQIEILENEGLEERRSLVIGSHFGELLLGFQGVVGEQLGLVGVVGVSWAS